MRVPPKSVFIVAAAAVVSALIVGFLYEGRGRMGGEEGISSGAVPPVASAPAGAVPRRAGGDTGDGAISKVEDTLVEHAGKEKRTLDLDGKAVEVEVDKADIELRAQQAERAASETFKKRQGMAGRLTPYHLAEADLKANLARRYGAISPEQLPELVKAAKALEQDFWNKGDFDDASSFDSIYEARALLELCLQKDPGNEDALRTLCEVLEAGWPRMGYKGDDPSIRAEDIQRAYDLYVPLSTLWKTYLSKRAVSSADDVAIAYDLTTFTWTSAGESPAVQSEFAKHNPTLAPELVNMFMNGVPAVDRIAVARWAMDGSLAQGKAWTRYADYFRNYIGRITDGRPPERDTFIFDLAKYSEPGQYYRYMLGRGQFFVGPEKRKAALKPLHVIYGE